MDSIQDILDIGWAYIGTLRYPAAEWYFALSSLILAAIAYSGIRRNGAGQDGAFRAQSAQVGLIRGFLQYLLPRSVYLHQSTRTDFLYILSFPLVAGLFFKPALAFSLAGMAYAATQYLLGMVWGEIPDSNLRSTAPGAPLIAAFTAVSALAADFGFYVHHYLLHKVSFLWQFHKVHHSAQVLTPLTDYRAHPMEILSYGHAKGIGLGTAQGIFNYICGNQISVSTVLGLNALFFLYYLMAYPLRHSHIWISYGTIASHFFISPAQHQIHHSAALQHRDKNLGGMFAIWDWAFGTLYVPKDQEDLVFGLGTGDDEHYKNFWQLYIRPFQTAGAGLPSKAIVALLLILLCSSSYYAFTERGFAIL